MNYRSFCITALLNAAPALSGVLPAYAADTITADTMTTAAASVSTNTLSDPRAAATGFVEHINDARVALAMKNSELAKQHMTQARAMVVLIKNATADQRRITEVQSGRVVYRYDTEYKYHYFPLQTGPVQVKQLDNGPMWAKNDLAVTDADIVYLTLDLNGDKAETYLNEAEAAVASGDLNAADNRLAQLTDAVVSVEGKVPMPGVKAYDNIALARNFIAARNYEGAGYALKHADVALDDMQKNEHDKTRLAEVARMRKDVDNLQQYVAQKDPSMSDKALAKMDKWWQELKHWEKTSM